MENLKSFATPQVNITRNTTLWSLGGTDSFRLASKKLRLFNGEEFGTNLQNQGERTARVYLADPGKVFVQPDESGADALIVSYLTPHGPFRDLFLAGIKPHTFVALHLFKDLWIKEGHADIEALCSLSPKHLGKHPSWPNMANVIKNNYERYFIGKKSVHSFNYRMSATTFIFDVLKESEGKVVLSKHEGENFRFMYHSILPEVSNGWWPELDETLKSTRTLRNLFGYPRYFDGPFTDKFFREATSFVPQSTVAVISNKCYVLLQRFIEVEKLDWDMLNQKHDSVLLQCPEDEWKLAAMISKGFMEQELVSPRGEVFRMKSGVSVGRNWSKYDKDTNPEGMKEL